MGKVTTDKKMKVKSDDQVGSVNEVNNEIAELKGQLVRALADYDNLRKRTEADRAQLQRNASLGIVLKLLPTLDILESAQKHLKDQGLAIAVAEFKNVLKEEGVEEIDSTGKFDETLHEALELVTGGKDGEIAEVVMPGYKFIDGLVIRHAKVKVYKSNIEKGEQN